MKILFRIDAGGSVGLGHFYRSINLVDQLNSKGHEIGICYKPSPFWEVKKEHLNHYNLYALPDDEEESTISKVLVDHSYQLLYVDGILSFSDNFAKTIRRIAKIVFYQNLSPSRNLCNVYISPSLRHGKEFYDCFNTGTQIYTGLKYLIFNKKVLTLNKVDIKKKVQRVGIVSGGSDPAGVLLKVSNLMDHEHFQNISFTYFYGKDFMHKNKIPAKPGQNVSFKVFNHGELTDCDILITTFGVVTYECMYLGIPVIAIGHQEENAQESAAVEKYTNAMINLGFINNVDQTSINKILKKLLERYDLRMQLSDHAKRTVDDKGIYRIEQILENLKSD